MPLFEPTSGGGSGTVSGTTGNIAKFTDATTVGNSLLSEDAANTVGQKNGLNAQTLNVYGTYTSASEWRRVRTTMTTGGAATIAAESLLAGAAGTGNKLILKVNSQDCLTIDPTTQISTFSTQVNIPGSGALQWTGRTNILAGGVGKLLINQANQQDSDITIWLGGATNAAAMIKKVATSILIRLGDDTGFAALSCGQFTLNDSNVVLGTTTGSKIGTATTQKLGFWDATPIVQPSSTGQNSGFTTGVGTHVHEVSTFTGGLGSTAYRISDIVRHLKSLGLIAQ